LNTKGGIVIIGVSDKSEVLGVDIGKKTLESLANKIKQSTDPKVYPSIHVEEIRNIALETSKVYWNERVCERADLEDIDEEKVRWFLRRAKYERRAQ